MATVRLWDVNLSGWENDSVPSRFAKENFQGSYVEFVKQVTSKPVVGVGRFTSPDLMVQLLRSGRLDMIGAARPSIADPFLPRKIAEGRLDDIRECIGCNICVSGDFTSSPIRCTQNPEWARVRDYRVGQLRRSSAEIFVQNTLTAGEILNLEIPHVVLATGAAWRRDGIGRGQYEPVPILGGTRVYTPDDLYQGEPPESPVVVYDSDHYYMGGVLCEHLRRLGLEVTLITPAALVSQWTVNTLEQERIQSRLLTADVELVLSHKLVSLEPGGVNVACAYTGRMRSVAAQSVVLVTARVPNDSVYEQLMAREADFAACGLRSLTRIGDCLAPSTIAAAVYAGHRFAREFESESNDDVPFLVERPSTS